VDLVKRRPNVLLLVYYSREVVLQIRKDVYAPDILTALVSPGTYVVVVGGGVATLASFVFDFQLRFKIPKIQWYNFMELSSSWGAANVQLLMNFPQCFMEHEGSLPCS
jgi:hypothetical protein